MMESSNATCFGLVYLHNIPPEYHACDLRSFFSQYIEASGFTCFHFRHRKELPFSNLPCESLDINSSSIVSLIGKKTRAIKTSSNKLCCLITLLHAHIREFILSYTGMHWFSTTNGLPLSDQCLIRQVHLDNTNDLSVISKLIELKPPEWMPQGNVGTPTSHFFNFIKCCQLDSSIIKKLRLDFTKPKRRKYCAVPYDYGGNHLHQMAATGLLMGELRNQAGLKIMDEDEYLDSQSLRGMTGYVEECSEYAQPLAASDDDDIDQAAEDWERFESLHDDPYKVERGDKANIKYEDKVELVWEKGGSGLVFHTDEYTWRKLDPLRKEEFFDEPASFDWDIDMEAYESPQHFSVGPRPTGHWGMARDTTDLIDMNRTKGAVEQREFSSKDEYGVKLMRRMGWLPGGSRRPTGSSLTDILPTPSLKKAKTLPHRGLGYYGPRLTPSLSSCDRSPSTSCGSRSVYIRTAFDRPSFARARTEATWQWPSLPDRQDLKLQGALAGCGDDLPALQPDQALSSSVKRRTVILRRCDDDAVPLSKEGVTFVSGGLIQPASFCIIPPRQCV